MYKIVFKCKMCNKKVQRRIWFIPNRPYDKITTHICGNRFHIKEQGNNIIVTDLGSYQTVLRKERATLKMQ